MEDLNHPSICWRGNTAGHKQSRRFIEYIGDNFLTQDQGANEGKCSPEHAYKEELFGDRKVSSSLDCSYLKIMWFTIFRGRNKANSRITIWTSGEQTLACLGTCFEESHGHSPGEEVHNTWLMFISHCL